MDIQTAINGIAAIECNHVYKRIQNKRKRNVEITKRNHYYTTLFMGKWTQFRWFSIHRICMWPIRPMRWILSNVHSHGKTTFHNHFENVLLHNNKSIVDEQPLKNRNETARWFHFVCTKCVTAWGHEYQFDSKSLQMWSRNEQLP